jgi:hypothetical protein
MRRPAIVAALLASLASAPTAGATEFTVNDRGDDSDNNLLDGACATAAAKCTLRAALEQANAASDADLIVFHGALGTTTIAPTTPLPRIVTRVTIDGGDRITIAPGAPAAAATDVALIDFTATVVAPASSSAGSTVRRIVLDGRPDGGGAYRAGPLIRIAVGDVTIETIVARNSAGNAIDLTANAQRVRITRSPVFAFAPGSKAIALAAGANGNVAAPQDLRVGPRRADGTLQVTGNSGGGTVELFRGDPATGPQTFANEAQGGGFAFTLNPEPAPGEKLSATLTDPGGNTSEFSPTATAPADLESPRLLGGVAISRNEVRVHASEALHPATVQAEDFALRMAGSDRSVIGASLSPDGAFVTLTSSTPWLYGEAGTVALRTPAAFTDSAGNESPSVLTTARVGGAPGDFDAPRVTVLRINPRRKVCVSKGPRCSKPGTEVSFLSSEDGEAVFTLRRGSHVLGQRRYAVEPGRNRIRYDGRLRGRKLSAGAYKLYVGVEDAVGNIAPLQPSLEFRIVKTRR